MNNNAFNVNMSVTDGQMLLPSRCAFFAYLSSTQSNVTGDGTEYTIISDTESFDTGNNYNAATGIFTAPVTALYKFAGQCSFIADSAHTGGTDAFLALHYASSGLVLGTNLPTRRRYANFYGPIGIITYQVYALIPLNASEQVYMTITSSGGSLADSVYGDPTTIFTYFSGFIVS